MATFELSLLIRIRASSAWAGSLNIPYRDEYRETRLMPVSEAGTTPAASEEVNFRLCDLSVPIGRGVRLSLLDESRREGRKRVRKPQAQL